MKINPKRYDYYADGLYYKVGVRNKMFFWNGFNWQSSTRDEADIKRTHFKQNPKPKPNKVKL